jgi:hypothetical protein
MGKMAFLMNHSKQIYLYEKYPLKKYNFNSSTIFKKWNFYKMKKIIYWALLLKSKLMLSCQMNASNLEATKL